MLDTYSYTGVNVAAEVENKFGDTGNVQISRDMILSWINAGIRTIAAAHDFADLEGAASTNLLAGTATYDLTPVLSAARVKSYASIAVQGVPLEMVTFGEWQGAIARRKAEERAGMPRVGMIRGNTLTVYPVPTQSLAGGLTVFYTAWPADVAAITDPLTIPDRLYNVLVDYVSAQAFELDENFEAAQIKLQHAEAGVRRELERASMNPTDFYPTISADPYDDEGGYFV